MKKHTTLRRIATTIEKHEVKIYRIAGLRCSHCGLEVTTESGDREKEDRRLLDASEGTQIVPDPGKE